MICQNNFGDKMIISHFIKIRKIYKMERELQKIELKNEFDGVKLRGNPYL